MVKITCKDSNSNSKIEENFFNNYQDTEEPYLNFDENFHYDDKDESIKINISNLNNEECDLDFEEYKKEIDKYVTSQKLKIEETYKFTKTIRENEIKEKFENMLNKLISDEKDKLIEQKNKKLEGLKKAYEVKLEHSKEKLAEELNNKIKEEIQNKITALEKELKKESNDDPLQVKKSDNSKSLESALKKIGQKNDEILIQYKSKLESKLEKQKEIIKKAFEEKLNQQINLNKTSAENEFKEKKNKILKCHQEKLEAYKEDLIKNYETILNSEKQIHNTNLEKIVSDLKDNYDKLKNYYNFKKSLFNCESNIINLSSLKLKLDNSDNHKSTVLKKLAQKNYFLIKKILRDYSNILNNNDNLIHKFSELLKMIFDEHLYSYLNSEYSYEIEIIKENLSDSISIFENILNYLNSDQKLKLSLLICSPKFIY